MKNTAKTLQKSSTYFKEPDSNVYHLVYSFEILHFEESETVDNGSVISRTLPEMLKILESWLVPQVNVQKVSPRTLALVFCGNGLNLTANEPAISYLYERIKK